MSPQEPEPIRIEITLPAPFETVWRAFRDPAVIPNWFGWEYEGLEEEIRYIFEDGMVPSKDDHSIHTGGHLFELDEHGAETVLRVTRAAPTEDSTDWDTQYDDIEEGWLTFLHQLRFALARHPGQSRRTVYLTGFPIGSAPVSTVERLGLADAAASGAGRRYRTRTPWGDPLAGKTWFRSTNQVGLTVDQWGDGLLIVFEAAPGEGGPGEGGPGEDPGGAVSAILTTYGLDERQFEKVDRKWADWWHTNHRAPKEPASDAG